jgi:hypothetical protein
MKQRKCALEIANWELNIPKLIASFALSTGESKDGAEARMAYRVKCRALTLIRGSFRVTVCVMSVPLCSLGAPRLPSNGCSILCWRAMWQSIKFWTGNGSDSVDKASLYKIHPAK